MARSDPRPQYGRKRHLMPSGYVRVWVPGHPTAKRDGYALEHRYVMHEASIDIPPGAHVHHRNGDRADNRLENLEVLSPRAHTRHHAAENGVINQFGHWPLLSEEERRERRLEATRRWRRRNRAHLREYKRRRVASGIPWSKA